MSLVDLDYALTILAMYIVPVVCLGILAFLLRGWQKEYKKLSQHFDNLKVEKTALEMEHKSTVEMMERALTAGEELSKLLQDEQEKNRKILSQKKSSETRLGQITEQIAPLLDSFPYDPKSLHFMGDPIDFVAFDLNAGDPAVVFIEVKSGNSKLSSRQRTIKNLISKGNVRFEEFRVSPEGIKSSFKGTKKTIRKKNTKQ